MPRRIPAGMKMAAMIAMMAATIPDCPRLNILNCLLLVRTAKKIVKTSIPINNRKKPATIDVSENPRNERLPIDIKSLQTFSKTFASVNGIVSKKRSPTPNFFDISKREIMSYLKFLIIC